LQRSSCLSLRNSFAANPKAVAKPQNPPRWYYQSKAKRRKLTPFNAHVRLGSGPTKLTVSTTSPVIPKLPTCDRTSIGAAWCQGTKSLRDSPLRGGVTGRTVIVDRTSSLLRQRLGPLFYRSSGGA
jgi:hypothetical protein